MRYSEIFEEEQRKKHGGPAEISTPLFHVSTGQYAKSIIVSGLKPMVDSYERRMGEKDPIRAVFMFTNEKDAMSLYQDVGNAGCIFKINPSGLSLFWANYADPATNGDGSVVVSLTTVPPSNIELVYPEKYVKKFNQEEIKGAHADNKSKVKEINKILKPTQLKIKCANPVCGRIVVNNKAFGPAIGVFNLDNFVNGLRNHDMMRGSQGDGWNDGEFWEDLDFTIPNIPEQIISDIENIIQS